MMNKDINQLADQNLPNAEKADMILQHAQDRYYGFSAPYEGISIRPVARHLLCRALSYYLRIEYHRRVLGNDTANPDLDRCMLLTMVQEFNGMDKHLNKVEKLLRKKGQYRPPIQL